MISPGLETLSLLLIEIFEMKISKLTEFNSINFKALYFHKF